MSRDRQSTDAPVVAHVRCVTGHGGGPEKTILNTPRVLAGFGYRAVCAYMHPPGDSGFKSLEQRALAAGTAVVSIADRGPWDWRVVSQLVELCRTHEVEIWHGHDYKSNLLGLLVRRWWPVRLVTTLHGWVQPTSRMVWYNRFDRWAIRRYEQVMCVSQQLWQECRDLGISDESLHLIRNGIDTSEYRRTLSIEEAKTRLGIAVNQVLIGAVGRLSLEKGFDRLIRSMVALAECGRNVQLRIAGEGPEHTRLEELIQTLRLADRVRLVGHIADPKAFFQACDVAVLSSLSEGLPNVVLEAMALQVPVVATAVGEVPHIITHDVHGLLVPPDSVEALSANLELLAENPSLRERLARAGREHVVENYRFDERIRREAAVYDRLLGRTSKRSAGDTSVPSPEPCR